MTEESKANVPKINPELTYRTIRDEILDQKRCQFQLLSLAVTVTALVLAYASTKPSEPSIYIAPVLMNVVAIIIIFDKAVSFQRKVGYLQIMEESLGEGVWKWESNLDNFRKVDPKNSDDGKKSKHDETKETDPPRKQSYITTVGTLLVALNCICGYLFSSEVNWWYPSTVYTVQWVNTAIIAVLLIYGIGTFMRKRHHLIKGQHSGPQIRKIWESVLEKSSFCE